MNADPNRLLTVRRTWRALLAGITLAALTSCALGGGSDEASSKDSTSMPSVSPPKTAGTPQPTPSSAATPRVKTEPPRKKISVDTVTENKAQTVSGSGSALLQLNRQGDFAIVMQLDCSKCKGTMNVTQPDRGSPLGEAKTPMKGAFLFGVTESEWDREAVVLTVNGTWKATFRSWNSLEPKTGRQSGRGSDVIYLADSYSEVIVDYKPKNKSDSFGARIFNSKGSSRVFGNDEAFVESFESKFPGVIAITTNGKWTVEPR